MSDNEIADAEETEQDELGRCQHGSWNSQRSNK